MKLTQTIKNSLITLGIFSVPPLVIYAINWQWHPESLNGGSEFFFWLTETAGAPWGILTGIFFVVLLSYLLNLRTRKQLIKFIIIISVAILSGQIIKSSIKSYTEESRPFVLWIEDKFNVDDEYFYSLPRTERKELIKQYIYQTKEIPNWLYQHWQNETGYAFPSGHTLFSATWAFLVLFFLNYRKHYVLIAIFISWAVLIEISRISLGMHHPTDVLIGACIAWVISLFSYYWANKWCLLKRE